MSKAEEIRRLQREHARWLLTAPIEEVTYNDFDVMYHAHTPTDLALAFADIVEGDDEITKATAAHCARSLIATWQNPRTQGPK